MSNPSLSERLTTGAKAQGLTTKEARELGWTVSRFKLAEGAGGRSYRWRAYKRISGQFAHERAFGTAAEALRYIAGIEEAGVRS